MQKIKQFLKDPYNFIIVGFSIFFLFGFMASSPKEIIVGMKRILLGTDNLISDYIEIGGLGAAFINATIVGIIGCIIAKKCKDCEEGVNIMPIYLMSGFAFFGKNILNIFPILIGAYIYAKFQGEKFDKYSTSAMLATTLSPILAVTIEAIDSIYIGLPLGIFLGMLLGFLALPVSEFLGKATQGYNLYSMGFAGGILGTVVSSIFRNLNLEVETVSRWSVVNNTFVFIFFIVFSLYLVFGGLFVSEKSFKEYFFAKEIFNIKYQGNYYTDIKERSYLNIAVTAIFCSAIIIIMGGQLNGPIIGGIFTVMGFAAKNKNIFNMAPIMLGCFLGAFLVGFDISGNTVMLTMLFATTLAPFSAKKGILAGVLAGFLHMNLVVHLGKMHGGINLYNNGFSGGLVSLVLIPVIAAFERRKENKK